ncbi:DUF2784 domain-containing protein [Mycobacterium botniense]|nr:DUF2784 domain-containing protein [Mycobacterium botniense]
MDELLVAMVVAVHFGFLGYVLAGGFVALRWRRSIWLHMPAVSWGIVTTVAHLDCPLTLLERWARARAGMAPLPPQGFIAHYITGVIYPAGWAGGVQVCAFGIVALSWLLYLRRYLRPYFRPGRHGGLLLRHGR